MKVSRNSGNQNNNNGKSRSTPHVPLERSDGRSQIKDEYLAYNSRNAPADELSPNKNELSVPYFSTGTCEEFSKSPTAAPGQPVINGVPRLWQKKMIEHDLDVMTASMHDLVDFCDRAEAIATDDGQTQKIKSQNPEPPRKARSATSALATATKGTTGMQPKPMIKALKIQLNVSQMNFMLHPLKIASVAIKLSANDRKNRWCQ